MTGDGLEVRRAALSYAARGWRVHPVRLDKRPFLKHGVLDAASDARMVSWMWRRWPDAGVAIATGDGLLVIDVDVDRGGGDTLDALEREHGPMPATVSALTGGGGVHYYFRAAAAIPNSVDALGRGLDIRGQNGYVLAPPSPHPSGGRYEWRTAPDELPLAALPGWLHPPQRPTTLPPRRAWAAGDDPLATVPPAVYVELLTGHAVPASGMIRCPFHADRTPSLKVYATVEAGWVCFGCGAGGTAIDLGSRLYGITPRGRGFHDIRRRLLAELQAAA